MKIQRRKRSQIKSAKACKFKRTLSRRNGGVIMIELTKPVSYGFIVREDKVEDFLNHKRDRSKLDKVLKKANRLRKNMGVHE